MVITPNMGLIRWDLSTDPYDHSQLAANFEQIDEHDHTPGHGVQLGTNSLLDGSITTAKLSDHAVTTIKIADNAVGEQQLDAQYVHPLGKVIAWWRPSSSVAVPSGWVIPTGQTLSAADHGFGGGAITLPDLTNTFILGADVSGTGTGSSTPPAIGAVGGTHVANLTHTHTVNSHSHTVNSHSHTVNSHAHTVEDHRHDMYHTHTIPQTLIRNQSNDHLYAVWPGSALFSSTNLFVGEDGNWVLGELFPGFLRGYDSTDLGVLRDLDNILGTPVTPDDELNNQMEYWYTEVSEPRAFGAPNNHNYQTGSSAPQTNSLAPGTSSTSPGTDLQAPGTSSALSSQDVRPAFTGLLYLMKVKHG